MRSSSVLCLLLVACGSSVLPIDDPPPPVGGGTTTPPTSDPDDDRPPRWPDDDDDPGFTPNPPGSVPPPPLHTPTCTPFKLDGSIELDAVALTPARARISSNGIVANGARLLPRNGPPVPMPIVALDVNALGMAVGFWVSPTGVRMPAVASIGSSAPTPIFPIGYVGEISVIADGPWMAGFGGAPASERAFLWDGFAVQWVAYPGITGESVHAINALGHAVISNAPKYVLRGNNFWGVEAPMGADAIVLDLDAQGGSVGAIEDGVARQAARWKSDDSIEAYPLFGAGHAWSAATAINNCGDIVGTIGWLSPSGSAFDRAVLLTAGQLVMIDELVGAQPWIGSRAWDISDDGDVIVEHAGAQFVLRRR